jgi:hypothetical protein
MLLRRGGTHFHRRHVSEEAVKGDRLRVIPVHRLEHGLNPHAGLRLLGDGHKATAPSQSKNIDKLRLPAQSFDEVYAADSAISVHIKSVKNLPQLALTSGRRCGVLCGRRDAIGAFNSWWKRLLRLLQLLLLHLLLLLLKQNHLLLLLQLLILLKLRQLQL